MDKKLFVLVSKWFGTDWPSAAQKQSVRIVQCDVVSMNEPSTPNGYHPSDGLPPATATVLYEGQGIPVTLGVDAAEEYDTAFRIALNRFNRRITEIMLQMIGTAERMAKDDRLDTPNNDGLSAYRYWLQQKDNYRRKLEEISEDMTELLRERLDWLTNHPEVFEKKPPVSTSRIKCPNCGCDLDMLPGTIAYKNGLMALLQVCPACHEDHTVWFKTQFIGTTVDDCVATIPCRLFYPAEGETQESMIKAGVKKPASVMKGTPVDEH